MQYTGHVKYSEALPDPALISILVTGPCGYTDTASDYYLFNDPRFINIGGLWWINKGPLPLDACPGTYEAQASINHTPTGTVTETMSFTVGADAPTFAVPIGQTFGPPGSGSHGVNPVGYQFDPVSTATGSYFTSATDASLPGIGVPFSFTRAYNSADDSPGPFGVGWTHSYNASLLDQPNGDVVLRVEDGQQLQFTAQQDGSYLAAPGVRDTLVRLADTTYKVTRSDQVVYRFDGQGRLTSLKDRNNQGLTFSYDAGGRLSSVMDSAGREIGLTYTASGLLSGLSLPDGRSVSYGYTAGQLTSVTDLLGGITNYSYDPAGRLARIVDQNNHTVVQNTYDTTGRVIEQLDALEHRSTYAWDPVTQTSTFTDARGNVRKDVYSNNVLIQRIDPLGNTIHYSYDDALNLRRVSDPRGNTVTMDYDARGNLLARTQSITSPRTSYQEVFTYSATNDLLTYRNQLFLKTTYEYDAAGNLIKVTQPGSVITRFGRDPVTGLLTSLTDPRGKQTSLEYDASGNLTKVTSPLGNVTTMGYDAAGRVTSIVEPRGNVAGANPGDFQWTFTYDAADHQRTATDPLGNATTWSYDPAGNLESVTDANFHTTRFGYDAANRLSSVTAPDETITSYGYDLVGNLTSRTDANEHTTTFGYDAANRLTSEVSPTSQRWNFAYDASGNRTAVVTPLGNATPSDPNDGKISFTYDQLDRMTRIDYSDATPSVTFGYDAVGNVTSMYDGNAAGAE